MKTIHDAVRALPKGYFKPHKILNITPKQFHAAVVKAIGDTLTDALKRSPVFQKAQQEAHLQHGLAVVARYEGQ